MPQVGLGFGFALSEYLSSMGRLKCISSGSDNNSEAAAVLVSQPALPPTGRAGPTLYIGS